MTCPSCNYSVTSENNGIQCDKCKDYFHYHCTTLPIYCLVSLSKTTRKWMCHSCVAQTFPSFLNDYKLIEGAVKKHSELLDPNNPNKDELIEAANKIETELAAERIREKGKDNKQVNTVDDATAQVAQNATPTQVGTNNNGNDRLSGVSNTTGSNDAAPADLDSPPGTDNVSGQIKSKAIKTKNCRYFIQGRCKAQKHSELCDFIHPDLCTKFISTGPPGCDKSKDCQFYHPKLCMSSLTSNTCVRTRCFYYHVNGSTRPNLQVKGNRKKEKLQKQPPNVSTDNHHAYNTHSNPVTGSQSVNNVNAGANVGNVKKTDVNHQFDNSMPYVHANNSMPHVNVGIPTANHANAGRPIVNHDINYGMSGAGFVNHQNSTGMPCVNASMPHINIGMPHANNVYTSRSNMAYTNPANAVWPSSNTINNANSCTSDLHRSNTSIMTDNHINVGMPNDSYMYVKTGVPNTHLIDPRLSHICHADSGMPSANQVNLNIPGINFNRHLPPPILHPTSNNIPNPYQNTHISPGISNKPAGNNVYSCANTSINGNDGIQDSSLSFLGNLVWEMKQQMKSMHSQQQLMMQNMLSPPYHLAADPRHQPMNMNLPIV